MWRIWGKMVEAINSWAQKIIIVIIICTILEMILPEGKNKKYIKTVIGIYVVFTIISPIISKLNNNTLDLSKYLEINNNDETVETSTTIDTNKYIEEVYKEKIKTDIITKIESLNYNVENINLEIETDDEETYGTILTLDLSISEQKQEEIQNKIQIEKVIIGEQKKSKSTISEEEKEEIKQYLAEIYYINEDCIIIN